MIKPRTVVKENETERPTFRLPKPDADFAGWGPRLRY
jgi:hypothetical protein